MQKGTRIASTRRQKDAPRVGLVGLQSDFQGSSATVTNPGLNPAETNAKIRGYHRKHNPSTNVCQKTSGGPGESTRAAPQNRVNV
jgi:hypothetical protein